MYVYDYLLDLCGYGTTVTTNETTHIQSIRVIGISCPSTVTPKHLVLDCRQNGHYLDGVQNVCTKGDHLVTRGALPSGRTNRQKDVSEGGGGR